MNESIINQLIALNFNQNEAKVYSSLLEIGQTSAGEVIKTTLLHRSVVYETLEKLIARKLVIKIEKQKIAFYQITDPSRILQNIKAQEDIALELLPRLKDLADSNLPEIVVYEGLESYRRFWLDSVLNMPTGSTDFVSGSIGKKWFDFMGRDYDKFLKMRIERQIKWKMIVFKKEEIELELFKKHPEINEFRIIDRQTNPDGNFNILGNESVILHSSTEPMIIEIKNSTLVKVFKNIFDILWEAGKAF